MSATKAPTSLPRRDPKRRHVDGASPWSRLQHRNPKKHYVFASLTNQETGQAYYEQLGYEIERMPDKGTPGVQPWAGCTSKPGEPIEVRGHVLMSISTDKRREIDLYGADGDGGQALVDAIEERIIDREAGGVDGLRGMRTRYMDVTNETGPAELVG